jgi:ABC-type Mn2+/Zn2+ transport system ATPase subunit
LSVNNIDRTRSTISATQRAISEEIFGLEYNASDLWNWLLRNSVWSQQNISRWIDASDSNAKNEIQSLANLDIWTTLFTAAKTEHKELKAAIQTQQVMVESMRNKYMESKTRYERNVRLANRWKTEHQERIEQSLQGLESTEKSLERAKVPVIEPPIPCSDDLDSIRKLWNTNKDILTEMKIRRSSVLTNLPCDWKQRFLKPTPIITHFVDKSSVKAEQCKTTHLARKVQYEQAKCTHDEFKKAGFCSACQRPFEHKEGRHDHLRMLQTQMEKARTNLSQSKSEWLESERIYKQALEQKRNKEEYGTLLENVAKLHKLDDEIDECSDKCSEYAQIKKKLTSLYAMETQNYSTYQKTKRIRDDIARAISIFKRNHSALLERTCPYVECPKEMEKAILDMKKGEECLKIQRLKNQSIQQVMQWTGNRGIQTYAMEYTVQKLTAHTSIWLKRFFGNDDMYLEAFFDEKERLQRRVICSDSFGIMSGGQWRRVQLASFMAWKDMNGSDFPLLIMDEACTSMDAPGILSVQETLKEWCDSDETRTCFFITHEPGQHRDTSIYNNHIKISNKRGRSSLQDEVTTKRRKL